MRPSRMQPGILMIAAIIVAISIIFKIWTNDWDWLDIVVLIMAAAIIVLIAANILRHRT